ncbi:MAG: FAD-dependent oxidoreductase [Deltaproteobacteria bacterium]|nr:FAD-dependent oxidoreductase [Deltaproteobacteria bacterium]
MAEVETKKVGAVMVVGGGIAGIQASLDLAESGYYVYLVEKNSAIGGVMAQLDKTFPTNDCSMCIISPKLVECGRHLNIELLTLSEIEGISGEPGNFQVKVRQNPRFVDPSKCTACGECTKVCPIDLPNRFDQEMRNRKAAYKLYPQAMPSAFAIEKRGTAPCKATCPAHISIQGFIALIAQGRDKDALKLIKQEMPFPAVCGRVCHHPCEAQCTRGQVDEPLAIEYLKRFVADLDLNAADRYVPSIAEPRDEKVAVIGGGPSGLTTAYYLAQKGYPVTLFEKLPVLGGMMAVGIPAYRLPRETLQAEIQVIKDLGVEMQTGMAFGRDFTLDALKNQGFQAVYLALGLHKSRGLGVPGEDLPQVLEGVNFLRSAALGEDIKVGKRTLVIGGGNVAIDVALTALRQGAEEVRLVCLEQRQEMPAWDYEVEEALSEGVIIENGWGPLQFTEKGGILSAVSFKKCVAVFDDQKRFNPSYDEKTTSSWEVDTAIVAIGQQADLEGVSDQGLKFTPRGAIEVDPLTLETSLPGVFAGGDFFYGPKSVVEAVACGKEAAESIHRFINQLDLKVDREKDWSFVKPETEGEVLKPRQAMPTKDLSERRGTYQEIALGFTEERARREAERCLKCGICSECYQCVDACLAKAIDHEMKPIERTVEVGSVVMAPGFQPFDPSLYEPYGYAHFPNVVTSMEFERILSASGPFEGHLVRPSDHKEPQKIAWLQCVGSRDINHCDHGYCSAVCCMYAIKEAVIAKEHSPHPLDTAIFFMDMRTHGKEFEKYYNRAQEERGVRFIRSRIHSIDPIPENNNLLLQYVTETGEVLNEEFDMVVLSVGLETSPEAIALAEKLGVPLDHNRFAKVSSFAPVTTETPGIYACGAFDGPKDIPQAVMEASAAACAATESLAEARGQLVRHQELPPEIDVLGQDVRVGVFVCNCGINIGGVADVPAVREYAKSLPHVVHVEDNLFTCSQDTQEKMKTVIQEKGINRVVVASCSPRTHEPLFQQTIREAGLNQYLFDMANIRDQDTWVHQGNPEAATAKAKDLVRMAVARVSLLEPLHKISFGLTKSILVIGGGVAGLTAAFNLAQQGYPVHLVERSDTLGGTALKLRHTWRGEDIQGYVKTLVASVKDHPRIEVHYNTEVARSSGFIGNYTTILSQGGQTQEILHGAVILATGGQEWKPDVYAYGQDSRIMTALELDQAIMAREEKISKAQSAVFIQCVGSREPERPYCSRLCCTHSVESALTLKKINPEMDIVILYRDMRTFGVREDLYREARNQGILFIRFDLESKPEVRVEDGQMTVTVMDHVLGRLLTLTPDLVTLASAVIPNPVKELTEIFKVSLNNEGFLLEAHMKLRPVDFATDGIYLCGLAHYPKPIDESIAQAQAAAGRALTLMAKETIKVGGVVAVVQEDLCAVCLTCVRACPFRVPVIGDRGAAEIDVTKCQGCGVCVSECPGKAINLQHFTDKQVLAKVQALIAA